MRYNSIQYLVREPYVSLFESMAIVMRHTLFQFVSVGGQRMVVSRGLGAKLLLVFINLVCKLRPGTLGAVSGIAIAIR